VPPSSDLGFVSTGDSALAAGESHTAPSRLRADSWLSRPFTPHALAVAAGVAVLTLTTLDAAGLTDAGSFETFALVFASISIEALPFVLLGAIVSGAIAVYVPARLFERIGRAPLAVQVPGAVLGGFAFPVCECGSVPVARQLIARGVHPAAGIAFMLASPILNPIVLASTWVAYAGLGLAPEMTAGRALLGVVVAVVAGLAIGRSAPGLLRPRPQVAAESHHGAGRERKSVGAFADHATADFVFMSKFLVLGAALAAALQTAVPQRAIGAIADTPVAAELTMIAVAFVLSLCSEADAFVAVSFVAFPLSAQLAFLVFGPVVDTKLATIYGATFRRWFALRLALIAAPVGVGGSLLFEALRP
jgi:uncharacterized protein